MNEATPIPGLELETQVEEGVETRRLRGAVGDALFGAASTAVPTRVGRFFILDRLGEGGMGTVYRGFDPDLDRTVAIKLVREFGSDPERTQARVLREAQALARLSHPNVVTVFEVGSDDDGVHVVMEYVPGGDLHAWARAHPVGTRARFEQALELLLSAGTGLAAAHRAGLIHRDFKPRNVLIGDDGRARVADFGLARADRTREGTAESESAPESTPSGGSKSRSSVDDVLTQVGAVVGTPLYMSPEQLAGGEVDARTDQYSYCVSAIEVLFGRRPFEAGSIADLVEGKVEGRVDPLPDVGAPNWVLPILRRGLAGDPDARFPSMQALLAALEHARGRRRRRVGAVVLGVAGLGLIGAMVVGEPERAASAVERCEVGGQRLARWWDEVGPRVEAQMAGSGAGARFPALERGFERHLQGWSDAFHEACTRTWVEGDASAVAFDARMQCLRRVESETRVLVEPWLEAGDDVAPLDLRAVRDLSDPGRCLRLDTTRIELPEDESSRQEIEQLDLRVAQARADWVAGRRDAALAKLEDIETRVRQIGHPPLTARMDFVFGRVFEGAGDPAASRRHLEDAFHAATAGFDDDTAIDAAIGLARHYNHIEVDAARAREWQRHAQTLADRSDAPPGTRAVLARTMGWTEMIDGKFELAERVLTGAIEDLRGAPGLDPIDLALLRTDRAPVLDRLGRLDDAREELERSLAVLEEAYGADHPSVGTIHLNLSSTLMAVDRLDEAREHANRALEIAIAQGGEDGVAINGPVANLAEIERLDGNLEAALRYGERALAVTEGVEESQYDLMLNVNNLGVIHLELGHLDEAIALLRRAVEIGDRVLGEHHPTTALHRGNLAETLARAGHYEEATALTERAVVDLETALGLDLVGHPEQLAIRAEVATYRGDHEAALEDARRLIAIHRKYGASPVDLAQAQAYAGVALAALGRAPEAEQELDAALAVLTADNAGDLFAAASVMRAELARADGDVERAHTLVTRAASALPSPEHPWAKQLRERHRALSARSSG